MTIKSTITKIIINGKKKIWNNKKIHQKETKLGREREREKEIEYWPFCREQLGRNMGERWKRSKKKFIRIFFFLIFKTFYTR